MVKLWDIQAVYKVICSLTSNNKCLRPVYLYTLVNEPVNQSVFPQTGNLSTHKVSIYIPMIVKDVFIFSCYLIPLIRLYLSCIGNNSIH